MSLWKIALRSIQQRGLSSCLTALSMALGVALVVIVLVVSYTIDDHFGRGAEGFDILVGANQGSGLDLVLNSVYHLGVAKANLPYSYYKEFTRTADHKGRYADSVAIAIPYCLGDSYEGHRVIGTTPQLFDVPYRGDQTYKFAEGRNFKSENYFEGVIGSAVARDTGLRVGDTFEPTHGVSDSEAGHKHDPFTVVGILAPTGTPNDRALFINIEGFYLLEGHAMDAEEEALAATEADHEHEADEHDHADHAHAEHDHADHDHAEQAHDEHETAAGHEHEDEADGPIVAPAAHTDAEEHADHADAADAHEHAPADEHADHEHAAHDEADHDHEHEEAAHEHAGHDHADHDHEAVSASGHDHADHDHADHDHAHHHEPLPENQREVTAILIRTANLLAPIYLMKSISRDTVAQAVQPQAEIYKLTTNIIGNVRLLLLFLALLVVIVAGVGIMVSIYNSMNDRRREIALMRSLGASRGTVLSTILLESVLLSLGGGILGMVIGHVLVGGLSPLVATQTGVSIGVFQFVPYELALIPGLILLAAVVGFLPAMSAYRTDVAKALSSS